MRFQVFWGRSLKYCLPHGKEHAKNIVRNLSRFGTNLRFFSPMLFLFQSWPFYPCDHQPSDQ